MSAEVWSAQINGIEDLAPELQAAVHQGIFNGMESIGIEGQKMVQENIATPYNGQPPAVFTTNLLESVMPKVFDEQALIRLVIGVSPSLGADRYAAPVETGARPHFPPSSALIPWVMRKLGVTDEKAAESLAFVIARSIAKRGTRGHEMFSRALTDLEPIAPPILEREIAVALAQAGYGGAQ